MKNIQDWPWQPAPDIPRLLQVLQHDGTPGRVPFLELSVDPEIAAAFLNEPVPKAQPDSAQENRFAGTNQKMRFCHALGFEAFWIYPLPELELIRHGSEDTAEMPHDERSWVNESRGPITSWAEFTAYPWPDPEHLDLAEYEWLHAHLIPGMGVFAGVYGPFEALSFLMGYETLCISLYDQTDLVEAMVQKLWDLLIPTAEKLIDLPNVLGIWVGDDMGFKTSTLVAPKVLRKYTLPIHQKLAEISQAHQKPYLLHSCGNLRKITPDFIEAGIDAKHSFEDVIQPVEEFYAEYGETLTVIGGIDIDLLARGTEDEVRARTREVLAHCAPSGNYILGSGNTVANYLKMENYLAMLDEGRKFNCQYQV